VILERYVDGPRHVEVQVFGDTHGEYVYLFERDCSVQRRHQKVVEEAPAPGLSGEMRRRMGEAAVAAAKAVGYVGAGTVEFLLDADGETFFFMEMNTRLQVEHPVTEMITGQDLVEWQLRVAAGGALPLRQDELRINGHAIEARVYAEDPANGFLPGSGTLHHIALPDGLGKHVRVDTGVSAGDEVSVHYDPMISKLIVWDVDRQAALRRMEMALGQYQIGGLATNIPFVKAVLTHPSFAADDGNGLDINFIETHGDALQAASVLPPPTEAIALAAIALRLQATDAARALGSEEASPWSDLSEFRIGTSPEQHLALGSAGSAEHEVVLQPCSTDGEFVARCDGDEIRVTARLERDGEGLRLAANVHAAGSAYKLSVPVAFSQSGVTVWLPDNVGGITFEELATGAEIADAAGSAASIVAPMPGVVERVLVEDGDAVSEGDPVMVMVSMKMETTLRASGDGTVVAVRCKAGDNVQADAVLVAIE